jgi:3-methyladenine DNA glycosylase AlkD
VTGPDLEPAFDPETAAAAVMAALLPLADADRAGQAKRYLKSDLDFLGVSVPGIRSAVTGTARSRPGPGRDGVLAWARALWREPVHERRTAAIEVLRLFAGSLESADLALVEAWIRAAHGWAYVRRGEPDRERFERYAIPMLAEKEFFISKAIGWVLRELSKKDPAFVAAWTQRHLDLMSGVTFREAVRRLPPEQAAPLQARYRKTRFSEVCI